MCIYIYIYIYISFRPEARVIRQIQSSTMDLMSARKTAEGTVKAVQGYRDDQSFRLVDGGNQE